MKRIVIWLIFLTLTAASASAETMFVTDSMKITLRIGPGNDRKILAMVKSDEAVNVLETRKEWSFVRTADGKEGWVISRFLTANQPNSILLEDLRQEHSQLLAEAATLRNENTALSSEKQQLIAKIETDKEQLASLTQSYETLKNESADFIQLKKDYEGTKAALEQQTQRAEALDAEAKKLRWNQNVRWFLSGAGVLLLGFIIGFSTKRQRRRSSLL